MKTIVWKSIMIIVLILVMFGMGYGLEVLNQSAYDPELKIAFLGTYDEADCIVLWQKDFAVMIDTGEERDEAGILEFLNENGIKQLDYLILTHPDKDHIGSAAAITYALNVKKVIEPFYKKENSRYKQLQARFAQHQVKVITPRNNLQYTINDINIYIYPPKEKYYEADNNYSLAVYIKHRDKSMLFCGDAENERVAELMEINLGTIDLYKLPNHGRYSENSEELLGRLHPQYTVVSSQRASQRMTARGDKCETNWFYTVKNTAVFVSDGNEIKVMDHKEEVMK